VTPEAPDTPAPVEPQPVAAVIGAPAEAHLADTGQLAHTGAGDTAMLGVAAGGALALGVGAVLMTRRRTQT